MKDERERLGSCATGFAAPLEDGFDPLVDRKAASSATGRIRAGAVGVPVALATGSSCSGR